MVKVPLLMLPVVYTAQGREHTFYHIARKGTRNCAQALKMMLSEMIGG